MIGEQDVSQTWHDLPEDFQAFRTHLKVEIRHPGEIATRPGKALDEPAPYRIAHRDADNGNLRGGLASYGPDLYASGQMAARLVDKIRKGMPPADIPMEVNPKIELVINLKVAQVLGLTIAPEVLYRADRLIR